MLQWKNNHGRCPSSYLYEPLCRISHGVGTVLAIAGLVLLLIAARGRPMHLVSLAIYGSTLVLLYLASTLYHTIEGGKRITTILQKMDHCAIFLLIAGSYTPLCLLTLQGTWGYTLLGAVWGLAILGIVLSSLPNAAPDWLRVTLYIIMGWLVFAALGPIADKLPPAALTWMIAGGAIYSVGTIIFATDWPHLWPGKISAHGLWHFFVLGGSACHFVFIHSYVAV